MQDKSPVAVCRTVAECSSEDGKRVDVVGVYTVYEVPARRKLDDDSPRPVLLMLGEEKGPFLEPFWHQAAARSAEELERFNGRRVRVRGTFRAKQPDPPGGAPVATMGGPCIHPVEEIRFEPDDAESSTKAD